jgi:4-aminobutyrate aminotransferase/(S)-3-amino-2-methylpropionate transaminase
MTKSIQTRTADLLARRQQHVPRGVSTAHPIVVASARGATLTDIEGREYLDFTGGIGVHNIGHSHPRVAAAARTQMEALTHSAFQVAIYESYVRVAERLNALAGPPGAMKTLLVTTGVEAVENAVKIARGYTNRPAVIAFGGSFHGRTLLGLTLTASNTSYQQNFGPFASDIFHAPYPYEYRGWTTERALSSLRELLHTQVPIDRVAAIIIEPVLGEGGFVPAPAAFLQELRQLATHHGIVLIVDEIQCGFGRTGRMFAYQHAGIEPDLIVTAKSLAGGFPLSGVIGKQEIMDAPLPGGLGGTYAGNPVACAAALAVLDVFETEDILARAGRLGAQLHRGLTAIAAKVPAIGDVRGLGAMQAIELVRDRATREPDPAAAARAVAAARERGLLLLTCGPDKNVVRILVPLIVSPEDAERGLAILAEALQ